MKKNLFKTIFAIIPAILAMFTGIILCSSNTKTLAEGNIPSYFSVYTASYSNEEYTKQTPHSFTNGSAFFLKDNEAVVLEFDKTSLLMPDGVTLRIPQEIKRTITINDKILSVTPKNENGFDFINNEVFKLALCPSVAQSGSFTYGKYSFDFSYIYADDYYNETTVSFNCTFYIFNYNDYCSTANKLFSKNPTNGAYYSKYSTTNLLNLEYDSTFFNVSITKVYQQLSYTTIIKYQNGQLNITNYNQSSQSVDTPYVLIDKFENSSRIRLTFNDLGTYYISYETINPYNNGEVFNTYYNTEYQPNKSDTVYVFGYQAFYTEQDQLTEFKKINSNNSSIVDIQADITSYVANTNNLGLNATSTAIFESIQDKLTNDTTYTIAKSNQAPIYFNTNATIDPENSLYYYFPNLSTFQTSQSLPSSEYPSVDSNLCYFLKNYNTRTPLSITGVYFVKLVYQYDKYLEKEPLCQYFIFEISNESPKLDIVEATEDKPTISSDQVTYNNVTVKKSQTGVFDAKSTLKYYYSSNFSKTELETINGVIVDEQMTFTDSGLYKIELVYGNKSQKKYVTYFTIDKTGIENVVIDSLTKYSGTLYSRDGVVNSFLTNKPVAISWTAKEKNGRAQTYAEYKYFPTSYSSTFANSLTSDILKNFYNSPYTTYGIPSTDTFSYAGNKLPVSTYSNTISYSTVSQRNVLSDSGLYIIKIYDQTALEQEIEGVNVIYKVLFIDNTNTNIIATTNDVWSFANDAKMTSADYTIYFGSSKLIQFEKMPTISSDWDEWFKKQVYEQDEYQKYFVTYKNNIYLKIDNIKTIQYTKNDGGNSLNYTYTLTANNNYSKTEFATNSTTGKPNEAQYMFYLASSSNSNIDGSIDSYKKYANVYHQVTFSTDNSKMKLYYTNDLNHEAHLNQFNVVAQGEIKYNYYQPTAKNTLSASANNEILNFSYCLQPSIDLTVDSIKMEYYAFEKSSDTNKSTYVFKTNPTSTLYIYQNGGTPLGDLTSEANTYSWKLNTETYAKENGTTSTRTKAGKYIITRTYTNSQDVNDPVTRVLIFIVDRNGIISSPEVDAEGNSIYYTGGAIKLQVLNNYQSIDKNTLFFYDIYFASQMSQDENSASPVLKTNLLPVTLYVPAYKYGYDEFNTNTYTFKYNQEAIEQSNDNEQSVVQYYDYETKTYKTYKNYKLSAVVQYHTSSLYTNPVEQFVFNKELENNYLTTSNSNSIITFNKEGYYHVIISSEAGDTFTFDFQISYEEPEYTIYDDKNNQLVYDNVTSSYYTNKSTVRITWKDATSKFLATINKDEISYVVSNGISGKIDPNNIKGDKENGYYVDLDLSQINGAYVDGSIIDITLQFSGVKEDYSNQQYFSKTSRIIVDLQAPETNILNLIQLSGLTFSDLREYAKGYGKKYNMSKSTGVYAYYSFVVDVSNFLNILKEPEQTDYDFYKTYYKVFEKDGKNTKYIIGNNQESEIYLENYNDTSSNTLFKANYTYEHLINNYVGKYVELIEEDFAGNLTVYTIYITDINNQSDTEAITYKSLTSSSGDTQKTILQSELSETYDIYSKYSLNLESVQVLGNTINTISDKYYQVISIGGIRYIKSPYSGDKYFKELEFTTYEETPTYTLAEITKLYSNASSQVISIYNVPKFGIINLNAYVLNKVLEYYTLANYESNQFVEGIIIKLPEITADKNILYATTLTVSGVVGGEKISPFIIDEKYFKEVQVDYISNNYKITYFEINNSRYFRLEITRKISKNDYFIYTFYDNFGEEYKIPHIYGQSEIQDPISSNSNIITSYNQNGTFVYYSSSDIIYKYDTTVYSGTTIISLTIGNNSSNVLTYKIKKSGSLIVVKKINIDQTESDATDYSNYFTCRLINGSIMSLTLKKSTVDVANGTLGNIITFSVELTLNQDFGTGTDEKDEKIFSIYNKVPKISLSSTNGEDITSILGNKSIYTNNVKVNYEQTNLEFPYEVYLILTDGTTIILTEEYTATENGTYTIIINYGGDISGLSTSLSFTIENTSDYKFSVMRVNNDGTYTKVETTGEPFTYKEGNATKKEYNHYIVNGDYTILLNESLNLVCPDESKKVVDEYTTIYLITSTSASSIYYSCYIAITKIPETYSLFKTTDFVEYDNVGNSQDLTGLTSTISSISTKDGYEAGRKIAWTKYYLIPENKITVTIYYGEIGKQVFTPILSETDNYYSITLKTSGVYYFKFTDLAGNSHFFGKYYDTEYFAVKYISSVIFEVNNESPINYAIYDQPVKVTLPSTSLKYYDNNAQPTINVELNGKPITVKKSGKNEWTFTETGLYKIWFTAKINEENIYEAPLYFTILSSDESRTVFTYAGYENAYIEDILLNGVSINSKLANENNGLLYDGKYLTELTLHKNDIKTGVGIWTFVINVNNEFNQKYTFTIWINNPTVPITISHESGTTTTDNIKISFLTSNILSNAGECILKISGVEDFYITYDAFENGSIKDLYELEFSSTREYYIEVTTLSGQLLFSSYINKVEPLNTVTIILIVVVSIVVVVGAVIFILMRRKMKIK